MYSYIRELLPDILISAYFLKYMRGFAHSVCAGMEGVMKKGIQRISLLLLVLALVLSGNPGSRKQHIAKAASLSAAQAIKYKIAGGMQDEVESEEPDDEQYSDISLLQIADYSANSVTLSWFSDGNNDGFHIYRKSKYDAAYKLLGTVKNVQYAMHSYTDNHFKRGIQFTYRVVAYRLQDESPGMPETPATPGPSTAPATKPSTEEAFASESIRVDIPKVSLASVSQSGGKVTVRWKKISDVDGYEIFRKVSGGSYQKVKTVSSANTVKWSTGKKSPLKAESYKVRALIKYEGNLVYGAFSAAKTVYSSAVQKVVNKFKKLQKLYPTGKYWNHMNKLKYDSSTVTNTPCHHYSMDDISTCNHYNCPNGILGFQCYGFAWKMSDLIYGRNAKIKKHKSFDKSKMGDVIRYSGHSAIITEKHKNYVVVGECNYGNTCMILWGRKVYRSELRGATYSRRY